MLYFHGHEFFVFMVYTNLFLIIGSLAARSKYICQSFQLFLISNPLFSFKVHQNIATPVSGTAASSEEHQDKLNSSVTMSDFVIFCGQRSSFIADIGSMMYQFYRNKTNKVGNNVTPEENTTSVSKSCKSTTAEVYQDVSESF